jgi:alpha-beta hydrolase superfamily lysophospholipase
MAAGTPMGSSSVSVHGGNGTITVNESASFVFPKFSATSTMQYDAATLRETAYSADFSLPRGPQHTDVAITPGSMAVTIDRAAQVAATIPADPSAPVELVGDNLIGSSIMIPALVDATDLRSFTLAALSGGKALVGSIGRDPNAQRPAGVPATDKLVSVDVASLRLNFWYDPSTFVVHEIAAPAQQLAFVLTATTAIGAATPAPAPVISPMPTPFPHFTSRDVTFTSSDGVTLAGTITIPEGAAHPRPAVVLVHGSGPEDRDEAIGPNAVFLQVSNALSNAGYVVLRYDKRSVGKSGGAPYSGTRPQLLDDVRAALHFAQAQPEVNAKRVFLLGHSEGGELVPSVAARDPRVAGIILMAPPALPLWQVIMEQVLASVPPSKAAETRREQNAAVEKMSHSKDPKDVLTFSSFDVDPAVDIARVHVPILILQGDGDTQVFVKDLPRLVTAARTSNARVTVRTFSNDNHLFEAIVGPAHQTPLAATHQYLTVPALLDQRVFDAMTSWLATTTAPANGRAAAR